MISPSTITHSNEGILLLLSTHSSALSPSDFASWYNIHAVERFQYSGILSARRWSSKDGATNLALYDVHDVEGLNSDEYRSIRPADPEREVQVLKEVRFDRRVYKFEKETGAHAPPADIIAVQLESFENEEGAHQALDNRPNSRLYYLVKNMVIERLEVSPTPPPVSRYLVVTSHTSTPKEELSGSLFKLEMAYERR
ncbi:hypothetical protein T439DRAFT_328487 [Meredithblackwellia eburnea MCA 4105]